MLRESSGFDLNAETKLNEYCAVVRQSLDRCTIQDKRMALDVLDVAVAATQKESRAL